MKNQNLIIISVIGLILVVLVGFAYFSSNNTNQIQNNAMMEDTKMESETTQDKMMKDDSMEQSDDQSSMMSDYVDISPQQAQQLINENPDLVIIDVSNRYDQGHIPGALNYYVGDGSLDEAIPTLDKSKTYLVYCHVDSASIAGAEKLVEAGFSDVYRLEGNYSAWVDAGYPVEK